MSVSEVTEQLLNQMVSSKNNSEFLKRMEAFLERFKQNKYITKVKQEGLTVIEVP